MNASRSAGEVPCSSPLAGGFLVVSLAARGVLFSAADGWLGKLTPTGRVRGVALEVVPSPSEVEVICSLGEVTGRPHTQDSLWLVLLGATL